MANKIVIILGLPKCGTTSLAEYLIRDSNFTFSCIKESWILDESIEKILNHKSEVLVDATTWYFRSTKYRNKVNYLISNGIEVSIVFLFRMPIELISSLVNFRIIRNTEHNLQLKSYFEDRNLTNLPLKDYQYDYKELLNFKKYYLIWSKIKNLNIYSFEFLKLNPYKIYLKICSNLEITPKTLSNSLDKSNQTKIINIKFFKYIQRGGFNLPISKKYKRLIKRKIENIVGSKYSYKKFSKEDFPNDILKVIIESEEWYKSNFM